MLLTTQWCWCRAYRAFQLLHELGDELLTATSSGGEVSGCNSSVGVLASRSNATTLSVLLFSQAPIGAPIAAVCTANVSISGVATIAGDVSRTTGLHSSKESQQ